MKPLPMFDNDCGRYKPQTLLHNIHRGNDLHLLDLCNESGRPAPCKPKQIITPVAPKVAEPAIKKDAVSTQTYPPLPEYNIKPVEERIAEAEAFRGELSDGSVDDIIGNILESARDFGELTASARPGESLDALSSGNHIITNIQILVANHFNITRKELLSATHVAIIARPRQIAMYLSRVLSDCSLGTIGRRFSDRDHTTILYAVRKIEELIDTDEKLAQEIAVLKEAVPV